MPFCRFKSNEIPRLLIHRFYLFLIRPFSLSCGNKNDWNSLLLSLRLKKKEEERKWKNMPICIKLQIFILFPFPLFDATLPFRRYSICLFCPTFLTLSKPKKRYGEVKNRQLEQSDGDKIRVKRRSINAVRYVCCFPDYIAEKKKKEENCWRLNKLLIFENGIDGFCAIYSVLSCKCASYAKLNEVEKILCFPATVVATVTKSVFLLNGIAYNDNGIQFLFFWLFTPNLLLRSITLMSRQLLPCFLKEYFIYFYIFFLT